MYYYFSCYSMFPLSILLMRFWLKKLFSLSLQSYLRYVIVGFKLYGIKLWFFKNFSTPLLPPKSPEYQENFWERTNLFFDLLKFRFCLSLRNIIVALLSYWSSVSGRYAWIFGHDLVQQLIAKWIRGSNLFMRNYFSNLLILNFVKYPNACFIFDTLISPCPIISNDIF